MRFTRLKHGIMLVTSKDSGVKLEWGRLGWFGLAVRRDLRGFTLNLFLYFSLHLSFAFHGERSDSEVKTYGGYIWPRAGQAIWLWAWNGGGSEISDPGTYKELNYMDFLFGRPVFTEKVLSNVTDWPLEMPEGPYYLDIRIERAKWKRPRWPFSSKKYRARIEVSEGKEIPVPTDDHGGESGTYGETRNDIKSGSLNRLLRSYKRDLIMERKFVTGDADWRPKDAEIGKS